MQEALKCVAKVKEGIDTLANWPIPQNAQRIRD